MLATACPSPEELRSYVLGDSDEDAARRLEEHLARCPACEETLAEFDAADDTLVRHLPLAAAAEQDPQPAWLERLRESVPPSEENAETPHAERVGEIADRSGEFLGAYRLLARIGRGGMGVVYRALHTQLDRVAAVKVLSPQLVASRAARARFDREIQIVGRLDHPGIVRASDAGRVGRTAYLVMEYVDGVNLRQLVRRGGPLTVAEACEAARH
ncbi:MAG: protein kinase, partial [Planctomycetes bacterium]|nr:protein kinase [Planctomycetota bacterium]